MRIAVIDIGTNSVRCRIVQVPVGGPRRTLDDEKAYTRLGRGVTADGRLAADAIDATITALDRMLRIAAERDVTHVRAVATAAVREASNAEEFLGRAQSELGLEIEVISDAEEARLAFLSAAEGIGLHGRSVVFDIGGGSLEIVQATDDRIDAIASVPLGAVVLSERFHATDPLGPKLYGKLVTHVRETLTAALGDNPEPVERLVGSGGNVGAIAAIVAAERAPGLASTHGFELSAEELFGVTERLAASSTAERQRMKGLPEHRVDIVVAGAVVVAEAVRLFGAATIIVNTHGIREGLVLDLVRSERGDPGPLDRMRAVRDFSRTFSTDTAHAEQVRTLALALFDSIGVQLNAEPSDRELLEAAALLHDIGHSIAYERHHRHSYHVLSHADLPGFSSRERRVIAAVARYHRGSLPKRRHEEMRDLDDGDRGAVIRLAALLRVADGLDRSGGQLVTKLDVAPENGALAIRLTGLSPLDIEVREGLRKADLLARVLGTEVRISETLPAQHPGREQPT